MKTKTEFLVYLIFCVQLIRNSSQQQIKEERSYQGVFQNINNVKKDKIENKTQCKCLNNGECQNIKSQKFNITSHQQQYCKCQKQYIGQKCQIQAIQLHQDKPAQTKIIKQSYKYFYYQIKQQKNMQKFIIQLCVQQPIIHKSIQQNSSNKVEFTLTTQNQDGSFIHSEQILVPESVQLGNNECKIVSGYYVSKIQKSHKLILALKINQKLAGQWSKPYLILSQKKPQNLAISYSVFSGKQKFIQTNHTQSTMIPQNLNNNIQQSQKTISNQINDKNNNLIQKTIHIRINFQPISTKFMFFNVLFSLTTLISSFIVVSMIFMIKKKILDIRTNTELRQTTFTKNFDYLKVYMPQLKYKTFQEQQHSNYNSSQIQCSICLLKFQYEDLIRKTPCNHSFHKNCIDVWFKTNLTCPICRRSLTQKQLKDQYHKIDL